jgi:hypothetical protein
MKGAMPTLTAPRLEIPTRENPDREPDSARNPLRWLIWPALTLAVGLLLFCHGCHGDEDNELFTSAQQKSPRMGSRGLVENADHDLGTRIGNN